MMLKNKKKKFSFLLIFFLVGGLFVLAAPAYADWAENVVAGLIGTIISALGLVLSLVMSVLVKVAQYNNFINAPAIKNGWVAVRDVCNMFFVLVLLIIAFATILKIEEYNYKKWLPKLILMAILINFSKTICGLLIDAAQVVMLTFVNAFKDIAAANLVDALGIKDILRLSQDSKDIGFWEVVGAYVLGLLYVIVALVVTVTMLAMLVMRIVMIWVYVVLSPMAYLMSAFPGGKSYSSKWWDEFTKNLIVGPVLAFFIWLSFVSMQTDISSDFPATGAGTGNIGQNVTYVQDKNAPTSPAFAASQASTPEAFMKFIIAIGMLIGGLKISQEIGGAAGSIAGKGMSALQTGAKIGLGGVAAVTGYRYASGVLKNYSNMRKMKREEKYKVGAEKLAGGIGAVKKGIMKYPNQLGGFIKNKTYGRAGAEAEQKAKEAKEARKELDIINSNYQRKTGNIDDWQYDQTTKNWKNKTTGDTKSHEDMEAEVNDKTIKLDEEATEKEKDSKKARTKQNKVDKYVKYGMMGLGAISGILTGGISGILLGAGIGFGLPKMADSAKHAGEQDLNIASNFRLRQLTEAKEKMKTDSNEEVLATMDDSSKSAFTRAAAAMEALERDLLSMNDAENQKEQIKEAMGGTDSNGNWKDKKVGSYVENMFDKKKPGGNKTFEALDDPDLESTDPEKKAAAEKKKEDAQRTIRDRYEQGVYSLDLDSGTLKKSIDLLALTMRNGEFVRQFKALKSQSKKDSIVKSLKATDSQEAKEKLSFVKDLGYAFGDDQAGKEKALSNFSMEDLADVFRKGTKEQQAAIKEAVQKSTVTNKIDIFATAKNELNGTAPAKKDLRDNLGI